MKKENAIKKSIEKSRWEKIWLAGIPPEITKFPWILKQLHHNIK